MPRVRVTVPFTDRPSGRTRMIGQTFECDAARAGHLVSLGLAERADGEPLTPEPAWAARVEAEPAGETEDAPAQERQPLPDNPTRAQLAAYADSIGVEYPAKANKAKIASLIEEAEGR